DLEAGHVVHGYVDDEGRNQVGVEQIVWPVESAGLLIEAGAGRRHGARQANGTYGDGIFSVVEGHDIAPAATRMNSVSGSLPALMAARNSRSSGSSLLVVGTSGAAALSVGAGSAGVMVPVGSQTSGVVGLGDDS